ncbi:50S ribosomal protein L10 [Candidatus Sumerlaeota bacterium]|nr:50S ribosomal protein L10 [Candidatus Sumerlaeota bacterium]
MVKQSKIDAVESVAKKLGEAKAVVLTDFRGLTVQDMTLLRENLRAQKIEYRVIKNRLFKRALEQADYDAIDDLLKGPTGMAFGYDDPVPVTRIIYEFVEKFEKLSIKGGLLEGKRIDLNILEKLSKLPSKDVLMSRLLGSIQSPASKLALTLKQTACNLVYALKALEDQKKGAATN